ncbi:FtsX-like permease family protein [Streptomyces chumphonensis]|uniref:FtsX-like permease family protein n=1 Tax=Streptomyces chumphonensis TaxID=1214925 RepID=UPI003D725CA3
MSADRAALRLALRLATGGHPQQRLRLVLLSSVAAVVAVTALFTCGVIHMLATEDERFRARTLDLAAPGETAVLRVDQRTDTWGLDQYPVVWLDPVSEESSAAMPPGMTAWPEPGGWIVSPRLAELAAEKPALAERFPDATVLGAEGVLNPGELLVYRHMPTGGAMGVDAVDVAGFGGDDLAIGEGTELDVAALALAVTGFVVLPLIVLAAAGTAVTAPLRTQRLALLRALGVAARHRRRLVVLEAATVFVPGLAVGTLLWALVTPLMNRIPVVDRPLAENALRLPLWAVGLLLPALTLVFAWLSVVVERRREEHHRATPRPQAGSPRLPALRTAPAVAAVLLLLVAAFREGDAASSTTLAGVVLLAAGVPLTLPLIGRVVGARMARRARSPEDVLAGRRLQYDPRSAVRPLYGVAALLVIAPVVAAWVGAARDLDPPTPRDASAEAVVLRGALGDVDFGVLLRDVRGAVAAPVEQSAPQAGPPVTELGASCADVGRLLGTRACAPDGALEPAAKERLGRVISSPMEVELVRPDFDGLTSESQVIVLAPRSPQFERDVRAAALHHPAALNVISEADLTLQESDLVSWIFGGITILSALTFLSLAVGMVDRTATARRGARLLTALGLTRQRVHGIDVREFLLGYAVVAGTGLAAGITASLAWVNLDPAIAFPFGTIVVTCVLTVLLAGAGVLGVRVMTRASG